GRLTVDNLQGGYSTGSAVADFMFRTGLSADERNMPLFYRNEGGAMIRTEALGNEGQGGGGDSKPSFGRRAWNWISNLFGRNKNKVEVGPAEKISEERFSNQISTWQIVSALLFNSTDPYSAIGNMGVGDYAEERENVGMAAMIFINPEAAAEGLERKALSREAMSKIWGAGPKRIDPQNLPKSVTEDWVEILAGRGVKQLDEFGVQAVTQNRSGISPKWVGSLEWKIKDVPGTVGLNSSRIVQHPDGKWGLVIDHDYTKIINLPTSSAVK
ncbi:hypothetical protein, partial [uncultured Chryseobacterium sp.]|uniref:hypothetical protein n=1 Tax=uncultured Chryseobacterium sp. TaxID=259322 RepID=UPI00258FA28F